MVCARAQHCVGYENVLYNMSPSQVKKRKPGKAVRQSISETMIVILLITNSMYRMLLYTTNSNSKDKVRGRELSYGIMFKLKTPYACNSWEKVSFLPPFRTF
jgi:hypothetical protein